MTDKQTLSQAIAYVEELDSRNNMDCANGLPLARKIIRTQQRMIEGAKKSVKESLKHCADEIERQEKIMVTDSENFGIASLQATYAKSFIEEALKQLEAQEME